MTTVSTDSMSVPAVAPELRAEPTTVELVDVVKDYGATRALDRFSLALQPGEFVALLGPSGCGKTTALRALAGLEGVTSGRILVNGQDIQAEPTNRRDMGMVFQAYSLFPHMTALQNVEYGLRMRKVARVERRQRALESLTLVGLQGREDRYAHQLSGGQQQRVALARALVTRPRVLLLDEPLSALDAKVRVSLRDQIRRIQTELGITTLFVTHDQEEALAVADRVAVMSHGRIEQIGTPEELYSRPQSAFVADFVGLSNRVPGEVRGGVVHAYGARFELLGAPQPDGLVLALVRPEDLVFDAAGLPGTVVTSSFLGSVRRTAVRLEDGLVLTVQHDVGDRRSTGEAVQVGFRGGPVSASRVRGDDAPASVPAS